MSSPVPLHLWPRNRSTAWRCDVPGKAVLNVLPQSRVCQQFGSLGSPCGAVGMPLRRVSTVLQSAATSGCISSQLARDRRGGAPELPGNLPDTFATGSRQRNLLTLGEGQVAPSRLRRGRHKMRWWHTTALSEPSIAHGRRHSSKGGSVLATEPPCNRLPERPSRGAMQNRWPTR